MSEDDGSPTTQNSDNDNNNNKLSWPLVAGFVFASTAAGPFGIESLVSAGGPAWTWIAIFVTPFVLMMPIILMLEELSSWMPSRHCNIAWVTRAMGEKVGFVTAILQILMNIADLPIYTTMASDYLLNYFAPHLKDNFGAHFGVRVSIIIAFGFPVFLPLKSTGVGSIVISLVILLPCVVGFIAGADSGISSASWGETPKSGVDVGGVLSTAIWLYVGFLANGAIASEVQPRALLKGQLVGLGLDVVGYALPVAVVLQRQTDWASWDDGALAALMNTILPGLGSFVAVAALVSGAGLYLSSLVCYVRVAQGVASLGWLPEIFLVENRYGVPIAAGVVHILLTIALSSFSFSFLIKLEMVWAAVILVLFALAFVVLRFREPVVDEDEAQLLTEAAQHRAEEEQQRLLFLSQHRSTYGGTDTGGERPTRTTTTTTTGSGVGGGRRKFRRDSTAARRSSVFLRRSEIAAARQIRDYVVPGGTLVACMLPAPLVFLMTACLGSALTDWRLAVAFFSGVIVILLLYYFAFIFGKTEGERLPPALGRTDSWTEVGASMMYDDEDDVHRVANSEGRRSDVSAISAISTGVSPFSSGQQPQQQQRQGTTAMMTLSSGRLADGGGRTRGSSFARDHETRVSPHVAVDQI